MGANKINKREYPVFNIPLNFPPNSPNKLISPFPNFQAHSSPNIYIEIDLTINRKFPIFRENPKWIILLT